MLTRPLWLGTRHVSFCSKLAVERIKTLVAHPERISFIEADLKDKEAFDRVMSATKFDAVIHFAALKAVGESTQKPLEYYDNNLGSLFNLLHSMKKHGVDKIGELFVILVPQTFAVGRPITFPLPASPSRNPLIPCSFFLLRDRVRQRCAPVHGGLAYGH